MAQVQITLKLKKIGAVLSWEVFLENTNSSSRINQGWRYDEANDLFIVDLSNYPVEGPLDVFVGCEGKVGGKVECQVIINSITKANKVVANNTDSNYSCRSYKIN
ncbi:MAG TPA: hypothetical protein VGF79_04605 [Bacteroidia bacterium]